MMINISLQASILEKISFLKWTISTAAKPSDASTCDDP
jgi:hypothetical protein